MVSFVLFMTVLIFYVSFLFIVFILKKQQEECRFLCRVFCSSLLFLDFNFNNTGISLELT